MARPVLTRETRGVLPAAPLPTRENTRLVPCDVDASTGTRETTSASPLLTGSKCAVSRILAFRRLRDASNRETRLSEGFETGPIRES
jgi:hypothetical protein